jgi:nucleoid-associated protein YgaU
MGILDNLKSVLGGKKADKSVDERAMRKHTVQSGETLFRIARQYYGDGTHYMKIFEANKNWLEDPDHIEPGQELLIPDLKHPEP